MTINNIVVRQLVVDKISELEDQVRSLRRWLDGPVAAPTVRKDVKKTLKKMRRKVKKARGWSPAQRAKFLATAEAKRKNGLPPLDETIDQSIDREGV